MKSEWKITTNLINGTRYYGIYRLRDASGVDHSGNREYFGDYVTDKEKAQSTADMLNGKDEIK